jgi:hypothetical protein
MAYAEMERSAPEECGCTPCLNWVAAREETYPDEARHLLDRLGIDFRREAEVYHNARLDTGLHSYGAWYHFVGSIAEGGDAFVSTAPDGHAGTFDLEPVVETFWIGFTSRTALVPDLFGEQPLVQVEIAAEVPWVIDEEEPL